MQQQNTAAQQFMSRVLQLQQQGKWEEADAEIRAVLFALHKQGVGGCTLLEYVADLA